MMTWAALLIIIAQGLLITLLLKVVNSFGAFTSALIRTHDANVRIHEHNEYLVEELSKTARQIRRISDRLPPTPDQEKSA